MSAVIRPAKVVKFAKRKAVPQGRTNQSCGPNPIEQFMNALHDEYAGRLIRAAVDLHRLGCTVGAAAAADVAEALVESYEGGPR
jgi:hypothetical protein